MSDANQQTGTLSHDVKGQCLCQKTQVTVKTLGHSLGACHCRMCRKWGGGPLLAVDCGSAVSINGEDHVAVFDSSEWADRGFCRECGTHLFYRIKSTGQHIMPIGLFDSDVLDNSDSVVLDHQIFVEEKPGYYDFANETVNLTGEEVFAQFPAAE